MNDEAVRSRAQAAGFAVEWVDARGQPQSVSTESLRRLLEALPDTGDGADGVPPLVTTRVGVRTRLPKLSLEATLPAELVLEDGNVLSITLRAGSSPGVPPVGMPGYHR